MHIPVRRKARALVRRDEENADWLGVCALALGAASVTIYFVGEDAIAATFALLVAAAIVAVVLRETMRRDR
jgi:hypothetical protein